MSFLAAGQATPHSASKLSTLTLVVGLLALAGCGGSSSSTTSSASTPAGAVATPTTSTPPIASTPAPSPAASKPKAPPAPPTTSTPATASTPAPSPAASKPKAPPAPARRSPPATASTPAPSSTPSAGQALSLEANPGGQLKYNKTSLTAKAGKVSIAFTNKALLGHNLTVASPSNAVVGATRTFRGGSKILTLNLKRGSYKFYCSVPGHRIAGMEGTLTVN